jgi:hypothetical protein
VKPSRRRLASLVVIAVAAAATLATTPPRPTPPPEVKSSLEGQFELTPDQPVAVQRIHVHIEGTGLNTGRGSTVTFTPNTVISPPGPALVRYSIVPRDDRARPDTAFRRLDPLQGPEEANLACTERACDGTFALIAEWDDPDADATATIDWTLDVRVQVWSGVAGGEPVLTVVAEDSDGGDAPTLSRAAVSGAPVRLDVRQRFAQWRVSMRLGDGPLEAEPTWPLVARALLKAKGDVVEAPEGAAVELPFVSVKGTGDMQSVGTDASGASGVEFEPFWACEPDFECTADYLVGLLWADPREDVSVEAGFELDARAIGTDGSSVPVTVSVEPVPQMPMAVGTARGSLVVNATTHETFRYRVDGPIADEDDGSWDGIHLPNYAIWRATLRSTGSTPLATGFTTSFGVTQGNLDLHPDEPVTVGFVPFTACVFGAHVCEIEDMLSAGVDGTRLPAGAEVTVDWELEIGVGTTDPDGGTLQIVELPPPTRIP